MTFWVELAWPSRSSSDRMHLAAPHTGFNAKRDSLCFSLMHDGWRKYVGCSVCTVGGVVVCRLSCKKTGERGSQGQAIESSPVFLYFDLCSQSHAHCG